MLTSNEIGFRDFDMRIMIEDGNKIQMIGRRNEKHIFCRIWNEMKFNYDNQLASEIGLHEDMRSINDSKLNEYKFDDDVGAVIIGIDFTVTYTKIALASLYI